MPAETGSLAGRTVEVTGKDPARESVREVVIGHSPTVITLAMCHLLTNDY
jgi:hypothetical protein